MNLILLKKIGCDDDFPFNILSSFALTNFKQVFKGGVSIDIYSISVGLL